MSRIGSKDTKPELAVRKALHRVGLRFRLHVKGLPGRPDVVLPRRRLAVFVNGCFWHRCPHCGPSVPKSNVGYWTEKFRRNVERDRRALDSLAGMGWRVVVVWECRIGEGVDEVLEMAREGR